jgi:hypothetical protein
MRTLIVAASALAVGQVATAQEVVAPPAQPAPTASAPVDERTQWCDTYATWLIAMDVATASEADESQHLRVELNACRIDPQQYERETRADADAAIEIAQG